LTPQEEAMDSRTAEHRFDREGGMDIKRILCPIDLSEASAHSVEQAVVLAGYYKAAITALHVITPVALAVAGTAASAAEVGELDRVRRLTTEEFAATAARGVGLDVLVEVGRPAGVILERAASLPADLIVMGTHGASGFQHLVLGSVAEKVLRKAACPVLTAPPRAQASSQLPFRRLLCAVDFSDVSLNAVRSALSLAQESGASLTLLHVLEWPWEEPPPPHIEELPMEQGLALAEFRRYLEESARKRLESLVPHSMSAPRVMTRLGNGKPYVQILAVAAEEQTDLIVIGVRGRNPVDLALFGSTTNQVVRRATCPVLTLR
jgi:nucleotide-binding universal stress UspA family protein